MNIILEGLVPLPTYKSKSGYRIATLNNIPYWYRYKKSKIKNDFKKTLNISKAEKTYDNLIIHYRIVRNTRRKIDNDNVIFALKWLSDILEKCEYIEDDRNINFISYDLKYEPSIKATSLEFRITEGKNIWKEN